MSFSTLLLSVVFSLGLLASAQSPAKQQLAEAAADRIVKRFYEELDFGVIYREMYVSNPKLRKAEVQIIMENMIRQGDHWSGDSSGIERRRDIDFATMERAYIALSNFHWLSAAASMTHKRDDKEFTKARDEANEKYLDPMNDKKEWPILTSNQLDEKMTARFNGMSNFFRPYVSRSSFDTPEFKRRETAIEETRPPDSIEAFKALFEPFGLKPTDELYLVRRGRFYFYLLKENGELRMLTWTDRTRS